MLGKIAFGVCGILVAMVIRGWWSTPGKINVVYQPGVMEQKLANHTTEFGNPRVIKVTEGVYVAIGYALANSIMLEAPDGLIIVDTTESYDAAKIILEAFRKITKKPIKAIIYTHNHADHTYGAKAFIEDDTNPPDIWSHHTLPKMLNRVLSVVSEITYARAMRQFGVFLEGIGHINSGIGPALKYNPESKPRLVMPNKLMPGEEYEVNIAGLDLKLIHVPGETPDQICIWVPEKRVLLPADNIYKAFPNLYAIRGTPTRDTMIWARSLDRMRKLRANYLVPSHTRPLEGEDLIFKIMTEYRDAIQLVHDQTVRWMNKGLMPDEIIEKVKLPENLSFHPFLQEFYGTVEWSIRGVFDSHMGWFNGDPADLSPLSRKERASRLIKLAGGVDAAVKVANEAFKEEDFQWALELSSALLSHQADLLEAKEIKISALQALAARQVSLCGRNYYLTCALETGGHLTLKPIDSQKQALVEVMPIETIMSIMTRRLKAEEAEGIDQKAVFEFTDSKKSFSLHVRNCILDLTEGEIDDWDFKVSMEETTYRQIATKQRSASAAYVKGDLTVDGGILSFRSFMTLFDID